MRVVTGSLSPLVPSVSMWGRALAEAGPSSTYRSFGSTSRRMAPSQTTFADTLPHLVEDAPTPSASSSSSSATPPGPSTATSPTPPPPASQPKVMPTISRFSPSTSSSSTSTSSGSSSSSSPSRRGLPPLRYNPGANDTSLQSTHDLHVLSTRNNLLLTFSDRLGPLWPTISAGTDKTFKNSGRGSYEAAHQASLKMFERVLGYVRDLPGGRSRAVQIRLAFKGMSGQGGEAFSQALGGNDGQEVRRLVVKVEDRTGVKIGGTRPRKARRL